MTSEDQPHAGRFVGGEHRFAVRVYFEDTDLSGVVYHANYLRYMERARSDMLTLAGIDQRADMDSGGGYWAVHDLAITYKLPARQDDARVVRSRVKTVRAAACEIAQEVWRGGERLTSGVVMAAWLGMDGRPRRQPKEWRDTFQRLATEI